MDDLKRFRDFQRWECQRAEESYVKGIEDENRSLQFTAQTLPDMVDTRVQQLTKWIESRLGEFQRLIDDQLTCAIKQQNTENNTVQQRINFLEDRLDEALRKQDVNAMLEKEKNSSQVDHLLGEIRRLGEESCPLAAQVEGKLDSLTTSCEERIGALSTAVLEAREHQEKVQDDLNGIVMSREIDVVHTEAVTQKLNDESLELHKLIHDATQNVAAIKEACECAIEKESQETTAAMSALCERMLCESNKSNEEWLRMSLQMGEMKDAAAEKNDVWAHDMRMVQETLHFKLQKADEDLTAAIKDVHKGLNAQASRLEESGAQAAEFRSQIDALAKKSDQCSKQLDEKVFALAAQHISSVESVGALVDPIRGSIEELSRAVATMREDLDSRLDSREVRQIVENMRAKGEGSTSFTWSVSTEDMDKHEIRSPYFNLRNMENLQLRLHPRGRLCSKPSFSAIALVRKRETTNPFECEDALRVTFTCGSFTSKAKELDAWDDELDAAVSENFVPTAEISDEIVVTVVR